MTEFIYFISCLLLPRLFVQWNSKPCLHVKKIICVVISEVLMMSPLFSGDNFWYFLIFLSVYHMMWFLLEYNEKQLFLKRTIEFLFIVGVGSFGFGIFLENTGFNDFSLSLFELICKNNVLLSGYSIIHYKKAIVYFFAVLVLFNEMNNIIRYILGLIKTEPELDSNDESVVDNNELSRGKIIGVIERTLFFLFVLTGNYSSIAFILTAKGFTRFKELDDKNFAEYVLIGTLLSSALSIFWTIFIKLLIKTM